MGRKNKLKLEKVINKYFEYFMTKVKILYAQRKFEYDGIRVKYLLKRKKNSDTLVIVFSSCTRKGIKARYNYVRTLNKVNCSRVHILDDYAEDGRGSYYLGDNFTFREEKATNALIDKLLHDLAPQKAIFCGSSKGGYAALNFGLQQKGAYIITGAPQYYLASYLRGEDGSNCTYTHIIGQETPEKFAALENHLHDRICEKKYNATQKIYIHYSKSEHTYKEHICHLLDELNKNGYRVFEDVADYCNHSDISYFFPDYLLKTIQHILDE